MLTKVHTGPAWSHRDLCVSNVLIRSSGGLASDLGALPLFCSRKMMDKQTFSSIQATTNTSRYAAAVFHKGRTRFRPVCLPDPVQLNSVSFARRRFCWTRAALPTLALTDDPCRQVSFTSRR